MNTSDPFEYQTSVKQDYCNSPPEDLRLSQDSDVDGLTNWEEIIRGTNPYSPDTDGDGLRDLEELAMGTDPRSPDSDWNNLLDGADNRKEPQPNPAFPSPAAQTAWEYQQLSQGIDSNLPPFLQAKQVAQAALAEDFTASDVRDLLSESPQFKEIETKVGSEQADQFVRIAITAAERQAAIDSLPDPPQAQVQEQIQPRQESPSLRGSV